ncbi:FliA/WhiG family RNA polymerase sigma factor [bacterium]|nr:FliA/WhiG family RNA polymerase sigma factor [bacterium]
MQISEKELIEKYIPMVRRVATKIFSKIPDKVEYQELVSAGVLGLIEAAIKYDVQKNDDFFSFAEFRVRGAILDDLRSRDFISRQQRQRFKAFEQERLKFESQEGRRLSIEEFAQLSGISLEELQKTYLNVESSHHSEINENYHTRKDSTAIIDPFDIFSESNSHSPMKKLFFKEMRGHLITSLKNLPERNQLILSLYYQENLNFKEIGLVLDLTESRVSQLHKQSIKLLKEAMQKEFSENN